MSLLFAHSCCSRPSLKYWARPVQRAFQRALELQNILSCQQGPTGTEWLRPEGVPTPLQGHTIVKVGEDVQDPPPPTHPTVIASPSAASPTLRDGGSAACLDPCARRSRSDAGTRSRGDVPQTPHCSFTRPHGPWSCAVRAAPGTSATGNPGARAPPCAAFCTAQGIRAGWSRADGKKLR